MAQRDLPPIRAPGGLDHLTCSTTQLRNFVKRRTGQKFEIVRDRVALARRLQALDLEPGVFRFLDLPAELRNNVYQELLNLRPRQYRGYHCYPKILQTSKQILSEARGILYAGNKCSIEISCHEVAEDKIHCSSEVLSDDVVVRESYDNGLCRTRELWPAHLLHFSNLDLNISIRGVGAFESRWTHKYNLGCSVNNTLYSLCGFLSSSKSLKEINLKLTIVESDIPQAWLQRPLWPLSRVPKTVELHLVGFPSKVEEMIKAQWRISEESIKRALKGAPMEDAIPPWDLRINDFQYDMLAKLRAARKKVDVLYQELSHFRPEEISRRGLKKRYERFERWLRDETLIAEEVEVEIRAQLMMFDRKCVKIVADIDRAVKARMASWRKRRDVLKLGVLPQT